MKLWQGFGRRVSLAAGRKRTRNPAGRIRISPLPGVRHPGAGKPKEGGREALGLTEKVGRPEQACTASGQPAGGGGGLVRSCVWSRTLIARSVTSSHFAMRYMVTPSARAAASSAFTWAEASARARSMVSLGTLPRNPHIGRSIRQSHPRRLPARIGRHGLL